MKNWETWILYVYRNTNTGRIRVLSADEAMVYEKKADQKHIATIDAQLWLERTLNNNPALAASLENVG